MSLGQKTTSTSNRQHEAPEDPSARRRKSPLLEKPLNKNHSEASVNQIPYTTYQHSQIVPALDFPLPGPPQTPNYSSQLPDLEQHMLPVSEPSFDNLGTAFLPENLGIRQDLVTQAFKGFLSQNDPSHIYEMYQQQPPQYQPQVGRPSHIRAEGEVSQTLMQTHNSYSPAQPPHTRVGAEVSRPHLQTHNVSPPAISNADITKKTTDSDPALPGDNQDQVNNDSSSPTRSEADIDSDYAESGFQETSSSIFEAENIEARFESIIRAVEGAGFESIDDMSTQYYTATFQEDTVSHWAQSRSRSRSLHAFLASLHASTNTWSDREVQGYRQQITEAAESLYVGELSNAMEDIMQNGRRRSQALGEKASSPISPTASSVQSLWQIIAEVEPSHDFKQKRTLLREKVSLSTASSDISLRLQYQTHFNLATYASSCRCRRPGHFCLS